MGVVTVSLDSYNYDTPEENASPIHFFLNKVADLRDHIPLVSHSAQQPHVLPSPLYPDIFIV